MRGIVKRKGLNQHSTVSGRKMKLFVSALFLSVLFLAIFNPTQAKAEEIKPVSHIGYEKPTVNTDTEYNTTDTEYNATDILPYENTEDSILEWDNKVDADEVQEFSEDQTDQPEEPFSIDLNKYYKKLGRKLHSGSSDFLRKAENQFLVLDGFITDNTAPKIPETALPSPDINTEGDLIASASITVNLKASSDNSQPVMNTEGNNSRMTSMKEANAVFFAAQKRNRWIKRKQTLF